MSILLIITIFLLNISIWEYFLTNLFEKIISMKKIKVIFIYLIYFFIPYCLSLIILKKLGLETSILSETVFLFALILPAYQKHRNISK